MSLARVFGLVVPAVYRRAVFFTALLLLMLIAGNAQTPVPPADSPQAFVNQYCTSCHNPTMKAGQLDMKALDPGNTGQHAEAWEKVVRKLRTGMMPPANAPRPSRAIIDAFAAGIETRLDRTAAATPNPGATVLHRLNRAEYANAIRELLAVDVDVATMLPVDDSAEGFDNISDVLGASPTLIQAYLSAAMKISRLAVGDLEALPGRVTYRGKPSEGLPAGTQGGTLVRYSFPLDAEYEITIASSGGARGGRGATVPRAPDVVVTFDGATLPVSNTRRFRIPVRAGVHTVGAALIPRDNSAGVDEVYSVGTGGPYAVSSIVIAGPYNATSVGDTPARKRIFVCQPAQPSEELGCAKKILSAVARRAFRRPVPENDPSLDTLVSFYQAGRDGGTFEGGIQQAVARVLVDPQFLFRFEREPSTVRDGAIYRLSDLELASRLSFFLWSSIPDDILLDLASAGRLSDPTTYEQQVRRMLKDPRAHALVDNFAGQWLYLRELKNAMPESDDFDAGLRASFERETTMLFETVMSEDRSIVDLLNPDFTFVDERLAKHYGFPNVRGSRFRRVALAEDSPRRGLLGQGSILLVTSAANRTSPVQRGKWILENILGMAPPAPPAGVETNLDEAAASKQPTTLRQRMEQHRVNPVCSSCHTLMDPIGFSMENFDLVGKWRDREGKTPIDATGQLVDGTKLDGPVSLRRALLTRSEVFVTAAAEKLLTYSLGRPLVYTDMPAVRAIVRDAAKSNYRFSALALAIAKSQPFQMRIKKTQQPKAAELR
jgi:mono/diheme cytochrome c family protein